MRSYDANTLAALMSRAGIIARQLVWTTVRNRATGDPVSFGLWNGDDHETITIGGEARAYYGAGTILEVPDIIYEVGFSVRSHNLTLSPIAGEVKTILRTYDARFAPVEIHRALYNPATRQLVSEPHRVFKGWMNAPRISRSAVPGQAKATIALVSNARVLTRKLARKKSDESQKLRGGDRFRRHADVSNNVTTYWGELKIETAP